MKAIFIFIGIVVCFYIGCNIGPNADDVHAYMQSEEYKAQERAHFERLTKWEKR